MKRRSFLAAAAAAVTGLILPYEPKRIYSFPSRPLRYPKGLTTLLEAHSMKEPVQGFTVTVCGTDINGKSVTEELVFPEGGGKAVTKTAFSKFNIVLPPEPNLHVYNAGITFSIGETS